jgi:signal transduction histidine kinase
MKKTLSEAEEEKSKSDWVAYVSHEMRTPLNAILGYAEMLQGAAYGPLSTQQLTMVERIITNTRRLLGMVNEILSQAQIEAGQLQIQTKAFKTSELLEEIHAVMDPLAHKKNLALVTKIDEGFPAILNGDPERLLQVLVNLVTNAIKCTERGEVRVRLFTPDPSHWAMQVSDTGAGLSKEAQKVIFEPFRQEDAAARKSDGVGLGLAIVKGLVTRMGGTIGVDSEPGQGAAFTVALPLDENHPESIP